MGNESLEEEEKQDIKPEVFQSYSRRFFFGEKGREGRREGGENLR